MSFADDSFSTSHAADLASITSEESDPTLCADACYFLSWPLQFSAAMAAIMCNQSLKMIQNAATWTTKKDTSNLCTSFTGCLYPSCPLFPVKTWCLVVPKPHRTGFQAELFCSVNGRRSYLTSISIFNHCWKQNSSAGFMHFKKSSSPLSCTYISQWKHFSSYISSSDVWCWLKTSPQCDSQSAALSL